MEKTPYDVFKTYAAKKGMKKLTVQIMPAEKEGKQLVSPDMVLIEGEAEALEFLGNLLLAHARYKKDCEINLGPKSGGNAFFNKKLSTHGLYIHRLPCLEEPGFKLAKR